MGEGREGGDMPPPPQTESPPAVVPNIFTLPRAGGRKGSDASLGAQTVVPPAAQNSGGDLLGLFDVFSPAGVYPVYDTPII